MILTNAKLQRCINVSGHAYSISSLVKVDACSDWRALKKLKNQKIYVEQKKREVYLLTTWMIFWYIVSHVNALDKIVL